MLSVHCLLTNPIEAAKCSLSMLIREEKPLVTAAWDGTKPHNAQMNLSFLEQVHQAMTGLGLTPRSSLVLVPGSHTPCVLVTSRGQQRTENGVRRAWLKQSSHQGDTDPMGGVEEGDTSAGTHQPSRHSRGNARSSLGALHGHFPQGWSLASRTPGAPPGAAPAALLHQHLSPARTCQECSEQAPG